MPDEIETVETEDAADVDAGQVETEAAGSEDVIAEADVGAGTVLGGDKGDESEDRASPADWPDDWRQKFAGDDEKLAKRLERMGSPRAVLESMLAAEKKLRGGAVKPALGDDPSEAEVAEYRKAHGIPDEAGKYEIARPDGLQIGEEDKPIVDGFLESAHAANMTPGQVNQALGWYYQQQDAARAEQATADKSRHEETVDTLRTEWGSDYRPYVNQVSSFLDTAPEGMKENLLGARMADGTLFGDNAAAMMWLRDLAAEVNPVPTLVAGAGGDPGKALGDEIASIEKRMRDDRAGYFKDEAAQKRYRDLLAARDRHAA